MTPTSTKRAASASPPSSARASPAPEMLKMGPPITSPEPKPLSELSKMEPPSILTKSSDPTAPKNMDPPATRPSLTPQSSVDSVDSVDSISTDSSTPMSPETLPSKSSSPRSPRSPKPVLPQLKTPKNASFPSEITKEKSPLPKSPVPSLLQVIKQEEDMKTPITPPTAYTDFLKAMSPALSTPAMSSPGTSRSTSFSSSPRSQPSTQPSTASSCLSCTYDPHMKAPLTSTTSAPMVPPSPYMRPPHSARTPTALRKLRIPQSPAGAAFSPASDSPKSSTRQPWDHYTSPRTGMTRPVSVKQVVTRTVTYTRTPVTPLEPAPKGKRRKLE